MDFEVTYTPEQEAFRTEGRAWLAANIPEGLEQPVDPGDLSLEQYQKLRELGRRLGAKGWLYPTYPKEYGGGDLSVDFVMILEEESIAMVCTCHHTTIPAVVLAGQVFLCGARRSRSSTFYRPFSEGSGGRGSSSVSPTPGLIWLGCRRGRSAMATRTSSMARRSTWAVCTAVR